MPVTPIHGLIAYFLVCPFTKSKKLRLLAFIAGMLPDLDGIPLLFNIDLYNLLHHELFHPPIYGLLLAIPAAIILSKYFKMDKAKSIVVFAASFAIHPVTDVFFTNWPVKLLWPFSQQQFSYPVFVSYNALLVIVVVAALLIQALLFIRGQKQ